MSDSSRHRLLITAEAIAGTTPENPVWTPTPVTSCTLAVDKSTNQSATLKSNRQIPFVRHGTVQVGGDIAFELGYGHHDMLLESALCGTWQPKATITATTISATAADNTFNDSANGFVTAGFEVGDPVEVTGFTGDIANNIERGVITALTAGVMTIGGADGDVIVDDAAGESVTITTLSDVLKAGTARKSLSVMRHFADQSGGDKPYHVFSGCEVNNLSLTVTPDAIVTGTFSLFGRGYASPSATAPAGSTYGADPTTEPFDAFTGSVVEGGDDIAIATEITVSLENGLSPRWAIGSRFSRLPSINRSNASGTVNFFFENSALLEKFYDEAESYLVFDLVDPAGNTYIFRLPKFKYTGGRADVSGEPDITLPMPFQGYEDPTTATNITVTRVPAA